MSSGRTGNGVLCILVVIYLQCVCSTRAAIVYFGNDIVCGFGGVGSQESGQGVNWTGRQAVVRHRGSTRADRVFVCLSYERTGRRWSERAGEEVGTHLDVRASG
jgi:hypothetical protein